MLIDNQLPDAAILYAVNGFFFIYAICVVFDYRDRLADRKAGIRSLINDLSEPGIDIVFGGSVITSLLTLVLLIVYFPLWQVIALTVPVIVLFFIYKKSKSSYSDYFFYFTLDGLMMLSAPFILLATFAR